MRIGVLGPLEIDGGADQLGMRDRAILAALSMDPGAALTAEQLADAVWRGRPPASAAKNLQGCISRLRKRLGAEAIETTDTGYRLRVLADDVDASHFRREVARVRRLADLHEWERAQFAAREALTLWRGRPLPDLEDWEPAVAEVARLGELRAEVEELAVLTALEAGHHHEVVPEARALVQAAPLRERRWTLLARAQYQAGHQADALRTLRRARTVLREELGLDPGPEIVDLERAVLRQDPSLLVSDAPPLSSTCPYPGLSAYGEDDAESFFGRDAEVADALGRLRTGLPLAVVGPSGSGKSSLVRAGVAASLRREGRAVHVITPGRHPTEQLSGTTTLAHPRPVLVVDQAEEVFSLCPDPQERQAFLTAVATYADHGAVVVCLRADLTGDLVAHPEFARLVEQGLLLLGPMSTDGLRAAIQRPADQAGLVLEPGLVDLLVREVEGEPGALPLLSHALRETWLRREGRTLTVAGYRRSGGVRGAIAQSAEAVYAATAPEDRPALRELMLRMAVPGPDGDPVRAQVPRSAVTARAVQAIADRLVAARLVTSDGEVVTLAHEALLQSWPRLQAWLEDDVEGLRILHHLSAAAEAWQGLGRPDSELYRGVRLERALAWDDRTDRRLTPTERDFLEAGRTAAASAARAATDLARTRGSMIRRLRVALVVAAVLLLVAVGAGFVALSQGRRAVDAATAAQARGLSAEALDNRDLALGALLAVEAVRLDDSPESRSSLSTLLSGHPALVSTSDRVGPGLGGLLLSPDGSFVAGYDEDNVVSKVDVATGKVIARYDTDGVAPDLQFEGTRPLALSPDGTELAVGRQTFSPAPVVLLDSTTWRPAAQQPAGFPAGATKAESVTFSGDGRHLAVALAIPEDGALGGADGEDARQVALVWDVAHLGAPAATVELRRSGHFDYFQQVFLDPHGRVLYGTAPLTAYRLHPRAGRPLVAWSHQGITSSSAVDLSPDGSSLVTAKDQNDTTRIAAVDTVSGRVRQQVDLAVGLQSLDFTPDGTTVLGAGDGRVLAMDPATLETIAQVDSQPTDSVQAAPDDATALISVGVEGTVVSWDLRGDRGFLRTLPVDPNPATGQPGFRMSSQDGRRVAVFAHHLGIADLATGTVSTPGTFDYGFFTPGAWRPDSRRFAVGERDGTLTVLDEDGGTQARASVSDVQLSGLDYNAEGSRMAVSDVGGSVWLVDADTLAQAGRTVRLDGYGALVTLAPDGRQAFVATSATPFGPGQTPVFDHWALLDLVDGARIATGALPDPGAEMADFAPDGRHVAVGFASGQMEVLDLGQGTWAGTPAPPSHNGGQFWVTYTPDGAHVLTSDEGGTIRLWDPATGLVENSLQSPGGPGSAQLRAGTSEVWMLGAGSGYAWDPGLQRSVDYACRIAGRDLTAAEWTTYVGDREQQPVCP